MAEALTPVFLILKIPTVYLAGPFGGHGQVFCDFINTSLAARLSSRFP